MKKVSIIVPVYNVEKYLERCLETLVNQTLKDIEIIIVNDGSKDGSKVIIDKYAEKYPDMIRAFHTENGGASKARNYALKYVTGEYIGFVDSDDYIAKDMYEKLYNKAIKENADIVCCNYYRIKEDKQKFNAKKFGNRKINKNDVFNRSIYEANLLFDEVPYIWNKIFKTDIIKNNNFEFDSDLRIYEDLLFTYKAFSKANKISRIDEATYYYIVSRAGSLTQYLTEKRFDIFSVTEKLNNYYKEIGKYDELKEVLLYVILKHIYVILEKNTLLKEKKLKLKYINKVFEFLNEKFPNWKENMYFDLQEKDIKKYTSKTYWKICTIIGFNIVSAIDFLKKRIKKLFEILFFRRPGAVYAKQCKRKIDEKSILIFSQQGNNLNGNMFYITKELATNELYKDFKINIGYSDENKEKFRNLLDSYKILNRVKLIKNRTTKFAKTLAKSKYLFTDTSMPIYFIKRKEQVYLNTWHGTPLKTLGKSTENDFFDIANVQKNFVMADYLLYPSEYMMDIMIRDYMVDKIANNRIMLCGYPRNEVFLRDNVKDIKEQNGIDPDKTIIAYMPTWRGSVRDVDMERQLKIAENHIKDISERLNDNQILYINMHPFIGNKIDIEKYDNVKTFPKNFETYDFLSICDILITDYSSVFFDFATTNKKIILFAYDKKEYFENRGVYLPFDELPFPKVETMEELIKEINSPIQYETEGFLNKFCRYERKDMSKLICEKVVLNKQNEIKIIDMPKSEKENVLLHIGDFKPNNTTKDFIETVNNTEETNYNYYVSYVTKSLRPNKDLFKKVIDKVNFYGQLGRNSNLKKVDAVLIRLLKNNKWLYNIFKNRYKKMHRLELKRIFGDIKFKTAIFYGDIDYKEIYQLLDMDCKRILYVKETENFNTSINKKVYNGLDYILTTKQETYDKIKQYCGQDSNIKLISPISNLNDFEKLIG